MFIYFLCCASYNQSKKFLSFAATPKKRSFVYTPGDEFKTRQPNGKTEIVNKLDLRHHGYYYYVIGGSEIRVTLRSEISSESVIRPLNAAERKKSNFYEIIIRSGRTAIQLATSFIAFYFFSHATHATLSKRIWARLGVFFFWSIYSNFTIAFRWTLLPSSSTSLHLISRMQV